MKITKFFLGFLVKKHTNLNSRKSAITSKKIPIFGPEGSHMAIGIIAAKGVYNEKTI